MIEEENIQIDKKQLFEMISDRKCDIFLGLLGSVFYGAGSPVTGLIMGYTINALSYKDPDKVKKKGLVWSLIHLVVAFGAFIFIFLIRVIRINNDFKNEKKHFSKIFRASYGLF